MDDTQICAPTPQKHPMTRPAQPPDNLPGASGKMNSPEKSSHHEKLKALKAQSEQILDKLLDPQSKLQACLIETHMILIDLLEALVEPEEPG